MILVDFNKAVIAAISVYKGPEFNKGENPKLIGGMIRHMFFNMILSYKKKYGVKFGDIVIACDNRNYWRKEKYWWYKGHRKHDRKESPLDWDAIFTTLTEIKKELIDNFNYKVIDVDGAEADDIIASLCRYSQNNDLISRGLFDDEPQSVLIISSDTDFLQLQKYKNVKQWSPKMKKYITSPGKLSHFINEHIVKGDTGDNIGNVLTSAQWSTDRASGVKPKKQTSVKSSRLAEFLEKGIDACETEEERTNYARNEELISFDKIPDTIYNNIVTQFEEQARSRNQMKIYNYFLKHKMKMLLDSSGDF